MNLEQIINDELKKSMKSGDKLRTSVIRSLRSLILEFNKSGNGKELNEEEGIKMLNSAAKKRRDSIEMYKDAGRTDLMEKEQSELEIILEFLPKQLNDDEIIEVLKDIINDTGATEMKDMGKVMGLAMKELKGKADGNKVKNLVKSLLEG
jgi:uncharacterized protein YqeY